MLHNRKAQSIHHTTQIQQSPKEYTHTHTHTQRHLPALEEIHK